MVLLLRQGIRWREDPCAAPESQALQVPCLPQEALYRRWYGHPRSSGSQGVRHQVSPFPLLLFFFYLLLYFCLLFFLLFPLFLGFPPSPPNHCFQFNFRGYDIAFCNRFILFERFLFQFIRNLFPKSRKEEIMHDERK